MELTTFDGDMVRTDSASKNPDETLPTTTLPSWIPPTPSTIPYMNHLPTTVNLSLTAHPSPATTTVNLIVNDIDGDPLVVTLDSVPDDWVVTLVGLQMIITPDDDDVGQRKTIQYTVDDLQGDGVVDGEVAVSVVPTATATTTTVPFVTTTTTTTTTLPPPCAVTSATLTPDTIKNVQADGKGGAVNIGVLFKKVTVSAATNGNCSGLEIWYVSGGINTPGFLVLTKVGPASWTGELLGRGEGSSETWSDGPHQISFHDADGGPYLSKTLTIT